MSESFIPNLPSLKPQTSTPDIKVRMDVVDNWKSSVPTSNRQEYFSPYTQGQESPVVDAKPYKDWATDNARPEQTAESLSDYAGYFRTEAIRQGAYTLQLEGGLRSEIIQRAAKKGLVAEPTTPE
jgi:hypothetical protein